MTVVRNLDWVVVAMLLFCVAFWVVFAIVLVWVIS